MSIRVAVTRTAADTGGGNQNITAEALLDATPKASLYFVTPATSDGVAAADAILSIGMATATDERAVCASTDEDGQGTSDADRRDAADEVIMVLQPGSTTVDGEADHSAFITNGATINWGNAPSDAFLVHAVHFAGAELSAKVGTFTLGNEDVETDVTGVGFEPDLLIVAGNCRPMDDGGATQYHISFGVVTNKASVSQFCFARRSDSGSAAGEVDGRISNQYGGMQVTNGGGMLYGAEFSDFDSDGFSCHARDGDGGGDTFIYLALNFGGAVDFWAGIIDSPTSTGQQLVTDPGFVPQFLLCGLTQFTALDTNGNDGSHGVGAYDGVSEYCISTQSENGAGTTDTQCLSDDAIINLPLGTGAAAHIAAMDGFIPDGWAWTFSDTEGTAKKWWALAIESLVPKRRRMEGY